MYSSHEASTLSKNALDNVLHMLKTLDTRAVVRDFLVWVAFVGIFLKLKIVLKSLKFCQILCDFAIFDI